MELGKIVQAVIKKKLDDHFEVLTSDNTPAILPKNQLSDKNEFFDKEYERINVDDIVTCIVLQKCHDDVILSKRNLFVANRESIFRSTPSMKEGDCSYGYVSSHSESGSFISFLGNSIGFLPDEQLPLNDSVYVCIHSSGSIPILKILFNKNLSHLLINESIKYMNQIECKHKIGTKILLDNFIETLDNFFVFESDEGYKCFVLKTYDGSIPSTAVIFYIDEEDKIYYACPHLSIVSKIPPLTCRGICIAKFKLFSLIRFKQFYCYAENNTFVEPGSYVYISLFFEIIDHDIRFKQADSNKGFYVPIYFGFIETIRPKYLDGISEFGIDFFYNNWAVCKDNNNNYFLMHRSQLHDSLFPGQIVKGSILLFNGISLIISDKSLPIFYEDCTPKKLVYGVLIKYDNKGNSHLLSISPFVECTIKEKRINNCLFSTYKCTIIEHVSHKVKCQLAFSRVDVVIQKYIPGLRYITLCNDKEYSLDIFDCKHESFMKEIKNDSKITVFEIDSSNVSYDAPTDSYLRKLDGEIVSGFVYNVNRRAVNVHMSRNSNGIIPAEYFSDYYQTLDKIDPPELGTEYQCLIIDDIVNHDYVLSKRTIDLHGMSSKLYNSKSILRALVIRVDENVTMLIEISGLEVTLEKKLYELHSTKNCRLINDDELYNGLYLLIEYFKIDNDEIFTIVALNDKMEFNINQDQYEEDIDQDNFYIPLSDTDNDPSDQEYTTCIQDSVDALKKLHEIDMNKKKYKEELEKKHNSDINALRSVIRRNYICPRNINTRNLPLLLHYLRTHDKLSDINLISYKTKLSQKTLLRWHEKVKNDENWSPLICKKVCTQQAMDDFLEDSIMYYIYKKFIKCGYQFNDRMCQSIALQFWEQHPEYRKKEKFTASSRWLKRFKKKYCLVNRRVHYHRRPDVTPTMEMSCKEFHEKLSALYKAHAEANTLQYLINIDETSWKMCNFGEFTWAAKGVEHVEFSSRFDEKNSITAIAAISASKECYKLPLCLVRKGLTDRATQVLDSLKQYFQIDVTSNGWSTVECFAKYLTWLRLELNERYKNIPGYTTDQEIDIVLDLYASHRNIKVKEIAKELHFNLYFIPAGFTDWLQPLDRYVFGALKSMARSLFYKEYTQNPEKQQTIEHACKILLDCWKNLSQDTIRKAWDIYSGCCDIDFDSLISIRTLPLEFDRLPLTINEDKTSHGWQITLPEEYDDDIIDDDDDSSELDIAVNNKQITNDITRQLKEVISYEKFFASKSISGKLIKPIKNIWMTCNSNTTIQVLSIIPGIRDNFAQMESSGFLNNDIVLTAINNCFKEYDTKEVLSDGLPIESCVCFKTDTCENIDYVLQALNYGLRNEDGSFLSTIQLTPDENGIISPCNIINSIIGTTEYDFIKVIALRKDPTESFEYEDVFEFGDFVFILKAVVCNRSNEHFYTYIRDAFSSDFFIVNDDKVKMASKAQIDESPTALGVYFIFQRDKLTTDDNESDTQEVRVETKELQINDDVKAILDNLRSNFEGKSKRLHYKAKLCKGDFFTIRKSYYDIAPRVKLSISGEDAVYMEEFDTIELPWKDYE